MGPSRICSNPTACLRMVVQRRYLDPSLELTTRDKSTDNGNSDDNGKGRNTDEFGLVALVTLDDDGQPLFQMPYVYSKQEEKRINRVAQQGKHPF